MNGHSLTFIAPGQVGPAPELMMTMRFRFLSHHAFQEWDKVYFTSMCFLRSFRKIQFPRKSVNLFFTLIIVKNKFTELWGGISGVGHGLATTERDRNNFRDFNTENAVAHVC